MQPERWAQVDRLLDEALERGGDARAAFLAEACAGDAALQHEVESLLAAHEQAQGFLKKPALEIAAKELAHQQQQLQQSAQSLLGKTLGPYQVLSVLGKGGMGEVYLAQDTRLGRKVALKLLPREFTQDKGRVGRFEREARAASGLNHPNILTIYEIGELDHLHFIAAEYIEGRTLREALAHGALPEKEVLDIGLQIAEALAAAHEAGIVHRDVKPENVMLRRDGYVKVLDFGLAKLTEPPSSQFVTRGSAQQVMKTNPGTILGTVRYMSPEQALGEEVDRRSDIFSLGVLLYELAAGAPPFKGATTPATLDAIVHHTPASLTELKPALHQELEHIVGRALEKERDLRYQSATDLRADLKRLQRDLNSAPTHSGSAPLPAPVNLPWRTWLTANAGTGVKAGAAALLLAALAAVYFWRQREPNASAPAASSAAWQVKMQTDQPGEELFPSLSPDGAMLAYARQDGGDWDIYWQRTGGSKALNLTENSPQDDTQPAFSPNGDYLAFRSERDGGGVFLMGADGASVRRLSEPGHAYHPAWSPDGREVLYTEDAIITPYDRAARARRLWVVNVSTLQKRLLTTADVAQPQWSPHGQRIAYWAVTKSGQRDIWTMTPDGGNSVPVTQDAALDWNPVWDGDGRALYFVSDRAGSMQLWRVALDEASGRVLGAPQLAPAPAAYVQHLSLSRDGKRLAFAQTTPRFVVRRHGFDAERAQLTGEPLDIVQGARSLGGPDVSPDGKQIAYYAVDGAQEDIYLTASDGTGQPQRLTDHPSKKRSPRWSPDGKRLAFYGNRTGHWEIWTINADGSGLQQMTNVGAAGLDAFFPVWSPDGARLLYNERQEQTPGKAFRVTPYFVAATPGLTAPAPAQPAFPLTEQFPTFWVRDWSRDGAQLAGGGRDKDDAQSYALFNLSTQQLTRLADTAGGTFPLWLRDNRRLFFARNRQLLLLDTQTGQRRAILAPAPDRLNGYALAPDNRWLYLGMDLTEADICLLSRE